MQKVNILGTEYTIETHKISEDEIMKNHEWAGYCDEECKMIVVADMTEKEYIELDEKAQEIYRKSALRHELVHAFLSESGLSNNSHSYNEAWAKNEEMIDWIALQFPKMVKVFQELDIL